MTYSAALVSRQHLLDRQRASARPLATKADILHLPIGTFAASAKCHSKATLKSSCKVNILMER